MGHLDGGSGAVRLSGPVCGCRGAMVGCEGNEVADLFVAAPLGSILAQGGKAGGQKRVRSACWKPAGDGAARGARRQRGDPLGGEEQTDGCWGHAGFSYL